jgi:hypothetical protein
MNLVDELRIITRKARESADEAYLAWRKKSLTAKFFKALKKAAEKGQACYKVPNAVENNEHWERWAMEHGFDYRASKVWWTIH